MSDIEGAINQFVKEAIADIDFSEHVTESISEGLDEKIDARLEYNEQMRDHETRIDDMESKIYDLENDHGTEDIYEQVVEGVRNTDFSGQLCPQGQAVVTMVHEILKRNDTLEVLVEYFEKPTPVSTDTVALLITDVNGNRRVVVGIPDSSVESLRQLAIGDDKYESLSFTMWNK